MLSPVVFLRERPRTCPLQQVKKELSLHFKKEYYFYFFCKIKSLGKLLIIYYKQY